MEHDYFFEVRGYELDSLNHVNNAVYLNYLEAARWKLMHEKTYNEKKWIDIVLDLKLYPVVTETRIRYVNELRLFDKAIVKSKWYYDGEYIVIKQDIFREESRERIVKATIKMIMLNEDRIVHEIPSFIKSSFNEWKNCKI